jgi:hypothetical protein
VRFKITLFILFIVGVVTAQTDEFRKWLNAPEGRLQMQEFANEALDKEECAKAAEIVDSIWLASTAERLKEEWSRLTITNDSLKLACACRTFGVYPKDGRSLFISMHGGGECPKDVNDEQWMNQIYLYQPQEGLYVAPRAPWNTWDLWHKEGLDELFEKLIQACVVFEGVNPNKVYILGYSAGGDGVWRMAPRMADKWAAASMMAGHPGDASQVNLMNLPFMIWMGENDHFYDRNILAKEKGEIMDSLSRENPGKYIHQTNIIEGKGHWMEGADTTAISWMTQYRRNPYPKEIIWRQEKVAREHFYWLSVQPDEIEQGKTIVANIKGNTIFIEECDYKNIAIFLNDSMLDLDKKVTVRYKGKVVKKKKLKRTISNLYGTLNLRNDRSYAFPCVIEIKLD